jgi:LmbE family N-acetylglucosaminyl deacetylase
MTVLVPTETSVRMSAAAAFRHFEDASVALWQDISQCSPILVVAPHPDDETLGCGGLIAEMAEQGIKVVVAVMTDGARSHPNSKTFDAERIRNLREAETATALRLLGLDEPHLVFFRRPDGFLKSDGGDGRAIVENLAALVDRENIESVFVTWGADPHPDHLAAYDLVVDLAKIRPELRVFAYPIWALTLSPETELNHRHGPALRLQIRSQRFKKRAAIACYTSQVTRLIDDDPDGFLLTEEHIELFCSEFEVFIDVSSQLGRQPTLASTVPTEHFDALYARSDDPWGYVERPYERNRFAETLRALPKPRYSNACEIGCSIGVLTGQLAARCDTILGVDCSEAALETARRHLSGISNSIVARMRVPDELPDGQFDLLVLSEVLYFFSVADLAKIRDWTFQHLTVGGDCILVNYLGDTESPFSGNEAAEAFTELSKMYLKPVSTNLFDGYRIDVLVRQETEAENR